MKRHPEGEMEEIMQEIANDLGYDLKEDAATRNRKPRVASPDNRRGLLLFAGSCAILLIAAALVLFAFRSLSPGTAQEGLQRTIAHLQERVDRLEGVSSEINKLKEQLHGLNSSVGMLRQSQAALDQGLGQLTSRIEEAERKTFPPRQEAKAATPPAKRPESQREEHQYVVQTGDTLSRIAKRYNITLEDLCLLNRVSATDIIYPGQNLIVARGRP